MGKYPMKKTIKKRIIDALRKTALEFRPTIKKKPSFVKNNLYEIALLQTALQEAFNDDTDADTIFEEIGRLTLNAHMDNANL